MTSVPDHVAQKTLPVLQKFLDAHQDSTDGTSDDQLMSLEQLGITVSTEGKAYFFAVYCFSGDFFLIGFDSQVASIERSGNC